MDTTTSPLQLIRTERVECSSCFAGKENACENAMEVLCEDVKSELVQLMDAEGKNLPGSILNFEVTQEDNLDLASVVCIHLGIIVAEKVLNEYLKAHHLKTTDDFWNWLLSSLFKRLWGRYEFKRLDNIAREGKHGR